MVVPKWMRYKFFFYAVRMKLDSFNHIFLRCRMFPAVCIQEVIREMSQSTSLPELGKQDIKPIALEIWLLHCQIRTKSNPTKYSHLFILSNGNESGRKKEEKRD